MSLMKEQEEEEQRKCKTQAHLYTIIKVAREEDLVDKIGKDIYFDLVDHDKVRSFRIQKQTPFTLFKEEVAREFGVPVHCQRFWLWAKRQNHTYRPLRPLTAQEEAQQVGQVREMRNKAYYKGQLKLFLEVVLGLDLVPVSPPEKTDEDILLFFKLYNPEKGELRYVGRLFAKIYHRPIEILPRLKEMAGFNQDEEIELFEEIKFEPSVMCEHLDKETSFRMSQIGDGDIICFQKADNEDGFRYPDVPSFLEYVHNRQATLTEFNTYFSNLEEIINVAESSLARGRLNASNKKCSLSTSETPTLEQVKKAKLSLKECLSDLFKLNVKDRLAEAVSTLSIAKSGLSQDQQKSVKAFWANFDEFTSDFLSFERDNVEFELQKLLKDQMFVTMKKNYETHILYKQLLGGLTEEEEELNKKLEAVKSRREKLISDWEILMVESEEAKSGYKDQEKKVAEAEEKKRIAEERMSRSTTAWSNLKSLFG
ncbi:ubiquitin C-terminal hydrolase 13-like isoform X4 [Rhodamnia argentea]|uniref:Ubiquitin C-terminal hydrolase 13-like isoform X4 n=1 Tax=Rhodamnia argentea TaxID=178133 RepID=A0ABM3HLY0_9MYRT|nr:ubiquitin C-terminal hydrolase 13-like isoform X4 [Rhodamnia argentea]